MIDKYAFFILFLLSACTLNAQQLQELSLEEAWTLLEQQYSVLQNAITLEQIHEQELAQLDIAKLPVILLKADGRLQSESTSLDTEGSMLPFEIDQPLFSLKSYVEANYNILDGGFNDAQRKLKATQLKADQQLLEVERYALRERINQAFVGILLLREQSKLFNLSLADLQTRKAQLVAGVELGTILESELTKLEVRELELQGKKEDLIFQLSGMIGTLANWIGTPLSNEVQLILPKLPAAESIPALQRPEQKRFDLQRQAILAQSDLIEINSKPKLNAYAQAGVGYPNPLNILDNNIAPFGVLGLGFSWPITDWKKEEKDKQLLSLKAQQLIHQQETFEFNQEAKVSTYQAEVRRLQAQIQRDGEIAKLQAEILSQLAVQLDEGVISSTDYLLQINAELSARQQLSIHQTELLRTQLDFLNSRGPINLNN